MEGRFDGAGSAPKCSGDVTDGKVRPESQYHDRLLPGGQRHHSPPGVECENDVAVGTRRVSGGPLELVESLAAPGLLERFARTDDVNPAGRLAHEGYTGPGTKRLSEGSLCRLATGLDVSGHDRERPPDTVVMLCVERSEVGFFLSVRHNPRTIKTYTDNNVQSVRRIFSRLLTYLGFDLIVRLKGEGGNLCSTGRRVGVL